MDPVSALGLVASITGIVSFGTKTVKIASQIRQAGSDNEIVSLKASADDTKKAAQLLRTQSSTHSNSANVGDQAILALADRSLKLANSISRLVEDVKGAPKDGKTPGRWSAVRQALRIVLSRDKISILEKDLNALRSGLQLQATAVVKEKLETNSMKLDNALELLDRYGASLLSAGTIIDELRANADTIIKNQSAGEILAETRHAQVMQYLAAPRQPNPLPLSMAWESELSENSPEEASRMERISAQRIIDWLWFPNMAEREEAIASAFDRTFEWVFCDPNMQVKPWDSFSDFLHSAEATTYWVTGKAGSGKSTLMKFIATNNKTKDQLQRWSGGDPVLIATHYFSHRATGLQRSPAGMLRSMLNRIFQERPDWVKHAYPDRYQVFRRLGGNSAVAASEPSEYQLRTGLENLIKSQSSSRFFLLVDGLDECKGTETDMERLVETLLSFAKHPNVKVLVSSRPWLVFEEALHESPRLLVHELTRDDIVHFTTTQIMSHHRAQVLQTRNPSLISTCIAEIADASSGVFLWVSLAVRSLLQGLRNHDAAEDLRARLHELPTELEDLFYHMWKQVPQRYKAQASRLLQLVEAGMGFGGPVTGLLDLSFAQENDHFAQDINVEPLPVEEIAARIDTTRRHLLTRTLGLVEVESLHVATVSDVQSGQNLPSTFPRSISGEDSRGYPRAIFIHKTVDEFLSVPAIRQELQDASNSSMADNTAPFLPVACLLRSTLVRIKTFKRVARQEWWPGAVSSLHEGLGELVYLFLALIRTTEKATGLSQAWLLKELGHAMTCHQRASAEPESTWLDGVGYSRLLGAGGPLIKVDKPVNSLFALAVIQHLYHTAKDMATYAGAKEPGLRMRSPPLILDALFLNYVVFQDWNYESEAGEWHPNLEMVKLLLQTCHGADDSVEIIEQNQVRRLCVWNIYADVVFTWPSHSKTLAVDTFLRIFTLSLEHHTDYKSTSANLDPIRALFESYIKDPHVKEDPRMSHVQEKVRQAIGMISDLEVNWARQRQDEGKAIGIGGEGNGVLTETPASDANLESDVVGKSEGGSCTPY